MSLANELKKIDPKKFERVAKRIVGEHNYSDIDLTTKCAAHRKKYPIYDYICKKIENNSQPLSDDELVHIVGMELMLRTIIVVSEE